MKSKKGELIICIICFLTCIYFFVLTINFPSEARFFPQFCIFSLAFLCLIDILYYLFSFRGQKVKVKENKKKDKNYDNKKYLSTLTFSIIYIAIINIIGFFTASFIYLFLLMHFLGTKNKMLILYICVGVEIGIYIVFHLFLNVPLEKGILF